MPARARRRWPVALALVIAAVAVILGVGYFGLGWWHPSPASSAGTPTPAATSAPPSAQMKTLQSELHSGDPVKLAAALDLDPSQVTPEETTGFATSRLDFDTGHAKAYGHGTWQMPVTITQKGGAKSTWTATVLSGPSGLVLLDTREQK